VKHVNVLKLANAKKIAKVLRNIVPPGRLPGNNVLLSAISKVVKETVQMNTPIRRGFRGGENKGLNHTLTWGIATVMDVPPKIVCHSLDCFL
jgi:hypothetical protein